VADRDLVSPRAATRTRTRLEPGIRRELIVDAAERVFAGRDPANVTLEEVASAAGVSRALVYNYFGDKGGVVAALYFRSFERLDSELAQTLAVGGNGPHRIRAVVECYLRFASENLATWRLIATTEAGAHPEVQRARRTRFERMGEAWGGGAEAHIIAHAVVGLLESATIGWLEGSTLELESATEVIHRMVWLGLSGVDGFSSINFPESGAAGVVPVGAGSG